jgi:hypothetical protein
MNTLSDNTWLTGFRQVNASNLSIRKNPMLPATFSRMEAIAMNLKRAGII